MQAARTVAGRGEGSFERLYLLSPNRANAQKSTGPRTEAGKNIARLNSVTHGLSGQTILVTPQQTSAFGSYSSRLMPDLAPANAVELTFAERIIFDSLRLTRAAVLETNLYSLADPAFDTGDVSRDDALNEAHAWQLNERSINLLSLYQQRLQRSIHRDLTMLRQMQKERKSQPKPHPQPLSFVGGERGRACPPIGSACLTPESPASPPPLVQANDPENMAA